MEVEPMKQGQEGDILRVTQWSAGDDEKNWLDDVSWCVVTYVETAGYLIVDWLIGGPVLDELWRSEVIASGDKFQVVPEKDWPDEVCVALAKRALIGG
jgi:hypothetical protein